MKLLERVVHVQNPAAQDARAILLGQGSGIILPGASFTEEFLQVIHVHLG